MRTVKVDNFDSFFLYKRPDIRLNCISGDNIK